MSEGKGMCECGPNSNRLYAVRDLQGFNKGPTGTNTQPNCLFGPRRIRHLSPHKNGVGTCAFGPSL